MCITTFNFGNATTRQREMHYYLIVGARDRFTHLLRLHQLRQLLLQIMNAGAANKYSITTFYFHIATSGGVIHASPIQNTNFLRGCLTKQCPDLFTNMLKGERYISRLCQNTAKRTNSPNRLIGNHRIAQSRSTRALQHCIQLSSHHTVRCTGLALGEGLADAENRLQAGLLRAVDRGVLGVVGWDDDAAVVARENDDGFFAQAELVDRLAAKLDITKKAAGAPITGGPGVGRR